MGSVRRRVGLLCSYSDGYRYRTRSPNHVRLISSSSSNHANRSLSRSYNPDSAVASIVSGILDSLSAGILLYTGLVELLAHDFLYSKEMALEASNKKVAASVYILLLPPHRSRADSDFAAEWSFSERD